MGYAQSLRTFVFLGEGTGFYPIPSQPQIDGEWGWKDSVGQIPELKFANPLDLGMGPGEYPFDTDSNGQISSSGKGFLGLFFPFSTFVSYSGTKDSPSHLGLGTSLGPIAIMTRIEDTEYSTNLNVYWPAYGSWLSFIFDSQVELNDDVNWSLWSEGILHFGPLGWLASILYSSTNSSRVETGLLYREEFYGISGTVGFDSLVGIFSHLRGRWGNVSFGDVEMTAELRLRSDRGFDAGVISIQHRLHPTFLWGLMVAYDWEKQLILGSIQRFSLVGIIQHRFDFNPITPWSFTSRWNYYLETWSLGVGFSNKQDSPLQFILEVTKQW